MELSPRIAALLEELCILNKRVKDIRREVFKCEKENGGFNHAGLYVYNLQTVTYEVPLPDLVAEHAIELGDPLELLTAAYFKIGLRGWPGFVRSFPFNTELMASMSSEADGGLTTVYGKPSRNIRASAPVEGKHIILQPKEKGASAGWGERGGEEDEEE